MELVLARGIFGFPVLNNEIFKAIKNAEDRNSIGSRWNRVCDVVLDWICWTSRSEAKKCIFDLLSDKSTDFVKMKSFNALRNLVVEGHQSDFMVNVYQEKLSLNYSVFLGKNENIKFDVLLSDNFKYLVEHKYSVKNIESAYYYVHTIINNIKAY